MDSMINKITEKVFVSDSPWQFRMLLVMVILFFGGGLFLDYLASSVEIPAIGTPDSKEGYEVINSIIEYAKQKHQTLSNSASLLYDFSKIALGALIASVAQNLKIDLSSSPKENDK